MAAPWLQTTPGTTSTWSRTRSQTGRRTWCAKHLSNPPQQRPQPPRPQQRHQPLQCRSRQWKGSCRPEVASPPPWSVPKTRPSVACSSTARWPACFAVAHRGCALGLRFIGRPTEISISSVWWRRRRRRSAAPDTALTCPSTASSFPSSATGRDDRRRAAATVQPLGNKNCYLFGIVVHIAFL